MNYEDTQKTISIIIPMYNERKRIKKLMQKMNDMLCWFPYDEVIFVDDGSTDGTASEVYKYRQHPNRMKVISLPFNMGKWAAIKAGFKKAKSAYCAFFDADLSVDPETVIEFYREELNRSTIIIGNRYGELESKIPAARRFYSRSFNALVKLIVGLKVQDSQCPMKIFSRNFRVATIFIFMKEKGFAGDVEFLARAKKKGMRIEEVDVIFDQGKGSNVKIKHALDMLMALLRIRKYVRET